MEKWPTEKEKTRMKAAITYDLERCEQRFKVTKEQRLEIFRNLGYLYDEEPQS
jgi:hypothetical protein